MLDYDAVLVTVEFFYVHVTLQLTGNQSIAPAYLSKQYIMLARLLTPVNSKTVLLWRPK